MLESCFFKAFGLETMVTVAQLVESRIVIPVVVGSSPIGHPKLPLKLLIYKLKVFRIIKIRENFKIVRIAPS